MIDPVPSPYLVPFDGSFAVDAAPTGPPADGPRKKKAKARLGALREELYELQRALYAENRRALLVIFQALDAGGKDSTIRHVLRGVNPAGVQVFSFKQPSTEELDHDFLWRSACRLPERGRIGVFNRSYYEEVLVARVHPEILAAQRLPESLVGDALWEERFRSIRDHELHLARNGTTVVKLWLNLGRREQLRRFVRRLARPEKNWKFSSADLEERKSWDQYQRAFQDALRATSRPWAPWYAIPADDKPTMRLLVAEILVAYLQRMDPQYPAVDPAERQRLEEVRLKLERELEQEPG